MPDVFLSHRVHKGHPRLSRSLRDLDGLAIGDSEAPEHDRRGAAGIASRHLVEAVLVLRVRHVLPARIDALHAGDHRLDRVDHLDGSLAGTLQADSVGRGIGHRRRADRIGPRRWPGDRYARADVARRSCPWRHLGATVSGALCHNRCRAGDAWRRGVLHLHGRGAGGAVRRRITRRVTDAGRPERVENSPRATGRERPGAIVRGRSRCGHRGAATTGALGRHGRGAGNRRRGVVHQRQGGVTGAGITGRVRGVARR